MCDWLRVLGGNGNDQPFLLRLDFPGPHWPCEVTPGPVESTPEGVAEEDFLRLNAKEHGEVIVQVIAAWHPKINIDDLRVDLANGLANYKDKYPPADTRAPFGVPNNLANLTKSSTATAEFPDECFNPATGIYEKSHSLFFFDLRKDPLEDNSLLIGEISRQPRVKFRQHCRQLNRVAKSATYVQNGTVCELDCSNLSESEVELLRGASLPAPALFNPDKGAKAKR